jgi:hypothetical protein
MFCEGMERVQLAQNNPVGSFGKQDEEHSESIRAGNILARRTTIYLSIYLSMALQSFVRPWPQFQFRDLLLGR